MKNGTITEYGTGKTYQPGICFIEERATTIPGDSTLNEAVWCVKIQAYRYVQQAKEISGKMAIPEASVVFTVKIPPSLSSRIGKFANSQRMTISKVVSAALEEFLAKKDHVQKRETS